MRKSLIALFAVALFVPAAAMAQHHGPKPTKPTQKPGYNTPGHSNKPGYNTPVNSNPGHGHPGNVSHPGNGYPGHGNPGNIGYPGHGHPGHGNHGPSFSKELMMAHRGVERAFQQAENSYYPFLMNHEDKRKMAFAMRKINEELAIVMRHVDRRYREDIRNIGILIDRARFTLVSENSPREAHKMLQRAQMQYNRMASYFIR